MEFRSLYLARMAELHRKVACGEVQQGTADDAGVLDGACCANCSLSFRDPTALHSIGCACLFISDLTLMILIAVRFLSLGFALHACLDKVGSVLTYLKCIVYDTE